jgi:hypothetical protein
MAAEWVKSQPWKFKVQAIETILAAVMRGDREAPIEPPVPLDASGPVVWQLINDSLFDAHVKVNSVSYTPAEPLGWVHSLCVKLIAENSDLPLSPNPAFNPIG